MLLPKKRISRGRTKGSKGKSGRVQCTNCGQSVPVDKAKKQETAASVLCAIFSGDHLSIEDVKQCRAWRMR